MINNFISEIKSRGLAKTNRYQVNMAFPVTVSDPSTPRIAELFCDSVNLPGMNIATMPSRFYGDPREMPYERSFDPVTMVFLIDSDMRIKNLFDRWMESIIRPTTRTINYYKNYITDINITVLKVNETDEPYKVQLFEAYPKTIGAIQMGNDSRDVMRLPVTFAYRNWTSTNNPNAVTSFRPPREIRT